MKFEDTKVVIKSPISKKARANKAVTKRKKTERQTIVDKNSTQKNKKLSNTTSLETGCELSH